VEERLTMFCNSSIPSRSVRGVTAGAECERQLLCTGKLLILAVHVRIALGIDIESQWHLGCTVKALSWRSRLQGRGRKGMLGIARWARIAACCLSVQRTGILLVET
jgi:hypothetical protein